MDRERFAPWSLWLAVALDAGLAVGFVATWADPDWLGRPVLEDFMLVVFVEFMTFFVIAMSLALGRRDVTERSWYRYARLLAFAVVFTVVVVGVFVAAGILWPVIALLRALWIGVEMGLGRSKAHAAFAGRIVYTLIAFFPAMATAEFAPLPSWGITADDVAKTDLPIVGGIFDDPRRVLAFGAIFFAGAAVWGATAQRRFIDDEDSNSVWYRARRDLGVRPRQPRDRPELKDTLRPDRPMPQRGSARRRR